MSRLKDVATCDDPMYYGRWGFPLMLAYWIVLLVGGAVCSIGLAFAGAFVYHVLTTIFR